MALFSSVLRTFGSFSNPKKCYCNGWFRTSWFLGNNNRISGYYMLFVTTILSVYFLPKLTLAKNNLDTKHIFWSFYKTILPVFVLLLIGIYFLRFYIVSLLFTESFLPVTNLFFWQLIADFLKVAALVLGYQFFAKKLTLAFMLSEFFSLSVLYFCSLFL